MAEKDERDVSMHSAEEAATAIEASEFNENLQETLYDGVLGFAISLGNAVALFAGAAVLPGSESPLAMSLAAAAAMAVIAVLLLLICRFSDCLQSNTANRGAIGVFAVCTVAAFVCNITGLYAGGISLASIAVVSTIVIYSGFLTVLPHRSLMAVVDIVFIYLGTLLIVLLPAKSYMIAVQGAAIVISLVFTASFQTRYAVRHRTISAEDSKKNNIKVRGNASTLLLVGFMLGVAAGIFTVAGDVAVAMITIGLAVLGSGLASLLLRSAEEKSYKEMMKKTMAAVSCLLLFVPLVPYEGKLVCLGLYLFMVFLNTNFILNAIIETSRFNLISSIWLMGREGSIFAFGALLGLCLFSAGTVLAPYWSNAGAFATVVAVLVCCCLQIKVNYQAYPFEPVLEEQEEVNPAVESAGKRKALWHSKIDATCSIYRLSPRETEVLHILLRGRDVKYIMDKFCISQSTAKTHVYNIYKKLGVHSRQDLLDFVEEIEVLPKDKHLEDSTSRSAD